MDPPKHCTIIKTLRGFSSCDGRYSVCAHNQYDVKRFEYFVKVTFYADGSCARNEGHVSIIFDLVHGVCALLGVKSATFSCTASVIDASGNKRFPRSFAFDSNDHSGIDILHDGGYGFGRFVKRSTLFSDPSDLLPDDSLTLCLEIDYNIDYNLDPKRMRDCNPIDFQRSLFDDGRTKDGWFLWMDTGFGRDLCKLSSVFRDMLALSSDGSEFVPIPDEEVDSFFLICRFLGESKLVFGLSDLVTLLKVADKYDMEEITRFGYQLFIMMMRVASREQMLEDGENHRKISEFIEEIVDDESRERLLAIYSAIKNKREDDSSEVDGPYAYKLRVEWSCSHLIGLTFEFNK